MTTTHTPIALAACSGPLTADQFPECSVSSTGPFNPRNYRWTFEVLDMIVKVLNGAPVAITLDTGSGYTPLGVSLIAVARRLHDCPRLTVRHYHGDGCTSPRPLPDGRMQQACRQDCRGYHDTWYASFKIGMILPLTTEAHNARWEVSKSLSEAARIARTVTA